LDIHKYKMCCAKNCK